MEQKTQKNGLINLLALLVVGTAGYAVARYGNTLAGMTGVVFMGIGALVAAVSWFQMRLEERERLEKLEFDELTKSAASSALFNARETEVFPAQRSREQFERFFVPAFTVLLFLLQAGGALPALALAPENHSRRRWKNRRLPGALFAIVRPAAVSAREIFHQHGPAGTSAAAAARRGLFAVQRLSLRLHRGWALSR